VKKKEEGMIIYGLTQKYVLLSCLSSGIPKTREHVSETGCVSIR
jgi:hypothetical protein